MSLNTEQQQKIFKEINENVPLVPGVDEIPLNERAKKAWMEINQLLNTQNRLNHGETGDELIFRIQFTTTKRWGLLNPEGYEAMNQWHQEDISKHFLHQMWDVCLTNPFFAPTLLIEYFKNRWGNR